MSFTDGGLLAVFPLEWIKDCIKIYTEDHGKRPKLLVFNEDDYLDYKLNLSLVQAKGLNIKITTGAYLQKGEIDLAIGIKEKKTTKKK
jgi:hypothetical protein